MYWKPPLLRLGNFSRVFPTEYNFDNCFYGKKSV